MNYLLKNNRAPSYWNRVMIAVIIFLAFILLRFFFSGPFSSLAFAAGTPLWNIRDSIFGQSQNTLQYADSKTSLISENTALKDEIYNLQLKNIELSSEVASAAGAPGLLHTASSTLLAKVLSKPPYSPFDVLILDQGKAKGIVIGDKIFIGENILIGGITETENSYSKAVLFSSGTNETPTNIARTGQGVSASGQGSGNFLVSVPKDFDIVVGDILVDTSSRQAVIAQVYSIDSSTQSSFKKVYARIPFNILQAQWVNIQIEH